MQKIFSRFQNFNNGIHISFGFYKLGGPHIPRGGLERERRKKE